MKTKIAWKRENHSGTLTTPKGTYHFAIVESKRKAGGFVWSIYLNPKGTGRYTLEAQGAKEKLAEAKKECLDVLESLVNPKKTKARK